jgi:hypothetical protein
MFMVPWRSLREEWWAKEIPFERSQFATPTQQYNYDSVYTVGDSPLVYDDTVHCRGFNLVAVARVYLVFSQYVATNLR